MALLGTTLTNSGAGAEKSGSNVSTFTTASFTPSNNSLLVVIGSAVDDESSGITGNNLTISDSLGGTWTSRVVSTGGSGWSYGSRIWTRTVTTGAAMTVTVASNAGSSVFDILVYVRQYTGYDTSTPVGGTGTASIVATADGAQSVTLNASPASTSEILSALVGAVGSGVVNVTQGSGYTELYDSPTSGWSRYQGQANTGTTSTTVSWQDVAVGDPSGTGVELVAIEIKAAGSGPSIAVLSSAHRRRRRLL